MKIHVSRTRASLSGCGSACRHCSIMRIRENRNVIRTKARNVDNITAAMKDRFGFAPAQFLMDLAEFDAIVAANPYAKQAAVDGSKVHIYFLAGPVPAAQISALTSLAKDGEALAQTDRALYLLAPNGLSRSALAAKLETGITLAKTERNVTSAHAIAALARTITL